jgi:YcxB-like protein
MIEITYQLTIDEYYRGLRTVRTKAYVWGVRLIIACAIASIVVELALLVFDKQGRAFSNLLPLAAISVLYLAVFCVLPLVTRSTLRKQMKGTPAALVPLTLRVSDSGLQFHSQYSDSTIAWSSFVRWVETESVFTIFPAPKLCHVVPKRAFSSDELNGFRELLRQKIGRDAQSSN